ncbi:MAG: N-acetylneuraminate synthase, partial [Muribaculaceae bacterium]|nr:N-acetylneuraminate synthase [Muribaculaceae bacterium]
MIRIIAEAGVNHNGSLEMAKSLVDAAADAGADFVKFQTFKAESLVTADAGKAEYQKKNMNGSDSSQLQMLKNLELGEEDHRELMDYCEMKGIRFLSTPFDLGSIDFLHSLGLKIWKIPSGEITNYPYLRKIAGYNEEVIMSTGMCMPEDVALAMQALSDNGQDLEKVTLLHCNTQYPTPMEDVNLKAMLSLKEFAANVGFSDHTAGIEIPVAAAALGASVIEKHFTLSRTLPGPDHVASLEPAELKAMVKSIRNVETALGDGKKHVTPSESANRAVARKSIVASRDIACGEILT